MRKNGTVFRGGSYYSSVPTYRGAIGAIDFPQEKIVRWVIVPSLTIAVLLFARKMMKQRKGGR